MSTGERTKRRREEHAFEAEMERMHLANQERRQRLKLEALTTVCGLFASAEGGNREVSALAAAVARDVLGAHVGAAVKLEPEGAVEIVSDDEADPDYYPGMPEPSAQEASADNRRTCSVMLFFSAMANERPPPQTMLASDLYAGYKRFCVALVTAHVTSSAMEREDVLIQARSSFGLLVRAIHGVQKRPTAQGTRYSFDWPAVVRHLHSHGGYCKDARL